ncbi:NADHX epimerase [Schizosaccharomyces osmophilus]|uniref:NAD(P)H-hydrate epimerase n=1 Tax=Schizosaccharomyces osmophilus TaxID=2545709 RepID=A0AAE9WEZ5_9SCHI|nr:NADHX epimerase [Schizosaccharomyces osmophilus]WBW73538.1 NADHX epimerase [Schizosaccharomyces osmophilus]
MSGKPAISLLSASVAKALDGELMSTGAFSVDQLMELAGLSVSQVVYREYPRSSHVKVLVCCGPGNNGGDGLVAARHLWQYGYQPTVYYPKPSSPDLYKRLCKQLEDLDIPIHTTHTSDSFHQLLNQSSLIVDSLFGFSFKGPVREPFGEILSAIVDSKLHVVSVDAPSSWEIDEGPQKEGPLKNFNPNVLISLTAPKPCCNFYKGKHYLGGRFVSKAIKEKYHLQLPPYPGMDQIVNITDEPLATV